VPEAPVNEDCDFRAAEDEISSPPDFNKWARRDTITHTHGMNRTSHSHLRLGVSWFVALHHSPNRRRCGPGFERFSGALRRVGKCLCFCLYCL